ncbi:hypothetical protein JCM33374_g3841 [Metschnikowia sp. JCM 33374]|nr:hypothetical protein JCM33374_g3841 [Metschnikowia sp. JCM 33374]
MDDIKLFLTDLENADSVNCLETVISNHQVGTNKINLAQSNNLMSSMYSSQSRFKRLTNAQVMFGDISSPSYSLRLSINSVKFCFTDISVPFGGLEILANGIEILRPTTGVCGHIISLRLRRSLVPSEFLLNHISRSNKDYPIIQFRKKGDENLVFELVCRGFLVDYHVNWLNLLNACKDQTPDESNKAQTTSTSSSHQNGAEIRILYQDFAFGMIPGRLGSKFYLTGANGSSDVALKTDHFFIKSSFRDLKLLLIDDIKSIASEKSSTTSSTIYSKLTDAGYVDVGHINLVHVGVTISTDMEMVKINSQSFADELSVVELKVNIDSACMDLCADSAHTLLQTINDLKEPVVFKDEEKFRVRGRKDFSLPLDIFDDLGVSTEGEKNHLQEKLNGNPPDAKKSHMAKDEFFFVDEFYSKSHSKEHEINDRLNNIDLNSSSSSSKDRSLRLVESHFVEKEHSISGSILPLSLALNVNQAEVYLHDGYDWKSTRKSIKSAVQSLEKRTLESSEDNLQKATINRRSEGEATSKNPEQNQSTMPDHREDNVDYQSNNSKLTQTIFQSIHIETDKNVGSSNLIEIINAQVRGDAGTGETELEAHTNVKVDKSFKDLKLKRSHGHKISAECKNIAVKVKSYPEDDFAMDLLSPKSEFAVMNSVEVSLGSIDVKDNVQSSTWNRMLTYMNALGEREIGTNMLALTITNVRPDSRMPYTEAIISLKVLPLRLFVDQDTLAFATRFFGFKDSRFALPVDEIIFVQKLTIDPIRVKFDYKPKSVDYAGIRSGNNAELANFFILDGSDLRLKKAVIYGAHGFPKVGKALAQIYGPYIQKYQLSGLLSGLSPVKSILNVGSGVKDLVAFPIQEYKRDGRIFYGLQKGSKSFAKSTTNELLRLGVKLASGAQVILENSEEYFGGEGASARRPKKSPKEKPIPPKPKVEKRKNLLESSQMLRSSVVIDSDQYSKPMSYIHSAIDEEDSEPEMENLQSSILVFNNTTDEEENEDNLSEETEKKLTSLYSNQPANAKEGLRSAYKAMGHNFKGSKKKFRELRRELKNADTLQEQIVSVAKKSPVIVIRPLIGGTEAMMKTLIGISNGIDSRSLQESHDKYRTDKD